MKLELSIDNSQLGDTILETFKSLSEEQKGEVAKQVLADWFKGLNEVPAHKAAYEAKVIEEMRNDDNDYYRNKSDESVRDSYNFRDRMKQYKNPAIESTREVVEKTIQHVKTQVSENLKNDPKIQELVTNVTEDIKSNFSKYVHDAMIAYFCGHMTSIFTGVENALRRGGNTEDLVKKIQERTGIY